MELGLFLIKLQRGIAYLDFHHIRNDGKDIYISRHSQAKAKRKSTAELIEKSDRT